MSTFFNGTDFELVASPRPVVFLGVAGLADKGLGTGLPLRLRRSRASISTSEKARRCLGLKGTGVETREVRNCDFESQHRASRKGEGWRLTELAALNNAIKDAWTTSSWIPTPHTLSLLLDAVHSIYVAAFTSLPPPMACSL